MAKMHELLAVETDLQGQYKTILDETRKVFKNEHLFKGFSKKLEMFDDEQANLNTTEHSEIGSTVDERLEYTWKIVERCLDAGVQKESTNQEARADLVVNGTVLAEAVPATSLLNLETKLKEIRKIYESIPTLDVGTKWEPAEDVGKGVFRQVHPEITHKTKKMFQHQVLVDPTEHHPAQVEKWEEQVPVGTYSKQNFSSMISSKRKAKFIERINLLSAAVKKARQRANNTEVVKKKIGRVLFDFIHAE